MFLDRVLADSRIKILKTKEYKKRIITQIFLLLILTLPIPTVAVMAQPSAPITTSKEIGERNNFAGKMAEPSFDETLAKTKWAIFALVVFGVVGSAAKRTVKYRNEEVEVTLLRRGETRCQEKIARNMLDKNIDMSTIACLTGLAIDQVENLAKKH
jgi:hypothetical protein